MHVEYQCNTSYRYLQALRVYEEHVMQEISIFITLEYSLILKIFECSFI
jgi:hypothetical protein